MTDFDPLTENKETIDSSKTTSKQAANKKKDAAQNSKQMPSIELTSATKADINTDINIETKDATTFPHKWLPTSRHALQDNLHLEFHTRPLPIIKAPAQISHLAIWTGEQKKSEQLAYLKNLCKRYSIHPPADNASSFEQNFGLFELRWACHTEFTTYTFIHYGRFETPFKSPPISLIPQDWIHQIPGQLIAALHVVIDCVPALDQTATLDMLHELFEGQRLLASKVLSSQAQLWTAMRTHSDGFGRIFIQGKSLNPCRTGRLVQRLLELEDYRLMAMMALPLAKKLGPQLTEMDNQLATAIGQLGRLTGLDDEQQLLQQLSDLARDLEFMRTQSSYRFNASSAYHQLVLNRLEALKEIQVTGHQTIYEFLSRRALPAMRTFESTKMRIDHLSHRLNRASNLLRTRVDLALESQNQQLMASMERHSRLQLRLQHAVEGLSIVAVSYYLISLLKYALVALKDIGLPINSHIAVGVALPFAVFFVWRGINKLKRHASDESLDNEN